MSKLSLSTARKSPKLLVTWSRKTRAMWLLLAFDGAGTDAGNDHALEDEGQDQGRDHRQHCRRGEKAIFGAKLGAQLRDQYRHGARIGGLREDHGIEKFAPGGHKAVDADGDDPRQGDGQDDTHHRLEPVTAIYAGGILQVTRDGLEVILENPHRIGQGKGQV